MCCEPPTQEVFIDAFKPFVYDISKYGSHSWRFRTAPTVTNNGIPGHLFHQYGWWISENGKVVESFTILRTTENYISNFFNSTFWSIAHSNKYINICILCLLREVRWPREILFSLVCWKKTNIIFSCLLNEFFPDFPISELFIIQQCNENMRLSLVFIKLYFVLWYRYYYWNWDLSHDLFLEGLQELIFYSFW